VNRNMVLGQVVVDDPAHALGERIERMGRMGRMGGEWGEWGRRDMAP
jgi:hypothetical protein